MTLNLKRTLALGPVAAVLAFSLVSCNKKGPSASGESSLQVVKGLSDSTAIIEFTGGKVTAADVKQFINPRLEQMNEEILEAYQQTAERMLVQKLVEAEMKKQGAASPEELLAKVAPAADVSDEQVNKFLKDNDLEKGFKDPKTGKRSPVKKEDVRKFLSEQQRQQKSQAFLQNLMASSNVKNVLPEKIVSIPLNPASPLLGNASAKVVIHEFSDFQCPYCERAHSLAGQIHQAYGDKVAVYFRHMPLTDKHPQAKPAAMASQCAHRQGKFWPMHDKLFTITNTMSEKGISDAAAASGLDMAKFTECLKDPTIEKEVTADMDAAQKSGVNGTPTFFLNGKRIKVGPQIEQVKPLIDAELAKK